jgi:hypothetical protein
VTPAAAIPALRRETIRDAAIGVATTSAPEGLAALRRPGCAAAIWLRRPRPALQAWLDALPPEAMPDGRVVLRPEDVATGVSRLCDVAGTLRAPARAELCEDAALLARSFAAVMGARCLRLRLAAVDTDSCRRFHVDAIGARLVCTYRGPGTQYGISRDGGPPTRVFQVPTGAAIMLRGTLWPGEATGLMHRSPPVEGTGVTRLVLVLDVVEDAEDAA